MLQVDFQFKHGHLFLKLNDKQWLVDTGSPLSFGCVPELVIAGEEFSIADSCMGMSAEQLSGFVETECAGLLGTDVLNRFNWLFDPLNNQAIASDGALDLDGVEIPVSSVMGIPVVEVIMGDHPHTMFFDTGAQLSYLMRDELEPYPAVGTFTDFYPGIGEFQTDVHNIELSLQGEHFSLRFGQLPELLSATLGLAGASGIVGNQVLLDRCFGYFARQKQIILGTKMDM